MSKAFDEAKQKQAELEADVKAASRKLKRFPKGPTGITPDDVKADPKYKAAKKEYDAAFAKLRAFNAVFTKQFKKELQMERRGREQAATDFPQEVMDELNQQLDAYEADLRAGLDKHFGIGTTSEIAKGRDVVVKPRKFDSIQRDPHSKPKRVTPNQIRPGMKFKHKTELGADGKSPLELKVFGVSGGRIHYGDPSAKRAASKVSAPHFYSKVLKEWC